MATCAKCHEVYFRGENDTSLLCFDCCTSVWLRYQKQELRLRGRHQIKREKTQSKRPKWSVGRQRR